MNTVTATFYAQVEPTWPYWAKRDTKPTGAKVARITQKKPDEPLGGCIVVKLKIELPAVAFMPLEPEAVVVVPEDFVQAPVLVTAEDPRSES